MIEFHHPDGTPARACPECGAMLGEDGACPACAPASAPYPAQRYLAALLGDDAAPDTCEDDRVSRLIVSPPPACAACERLRAAAESDRAERDRLAGEVDALHSRIALFRDSEGPYQFLARDLAAFVATGHSGEARRVTDALAERDRLVAERDDALRAAAIAELRAGAAERATGAPDLAARWRREADALEESAGGRGLSARDVATLRARAATLRACAEEVGRG